MKRSLLFPLVAALATGCATPSARTGKRVHWNRGGPEDAQIEQGVQALLRRQLTAGSAVQIALLENRELQARFEEIGIAQSEVIQAGLITNPNFSASFRFPNRPPSGTNIEYSIAQNFLELLVLPLRKRIANAQMAQTEIRVADEVLKLATEVKVAFYTVQARQQLLDRLRVVSETNETAAEFTKRLHDAGNTSDLELVNQQGSYEQSRLEVAQTELQVRRDRERLNRLLGLWGAQTSWTMADHLPELPGSEGSLRNLESRAIAQRLDLQATRMHLDLIGQSLALRTKTRYLPAEIRIGVNTERETDGSRVTGPTLDLELPIFNQGQGEIAKLTAQYRQAQRELEAMAINIRSEVRESRDQLIAARDLTSYIGKRLLPTQQQALNLTLQQYNFMLKGAYDLLLAKQNEVAAERSYIEAWRDYWIARAELERAVGGSLSSSYSSSSSSSKEMRQGERGRGGEREGQ
ncbi:MAG: TolC family protein [Verrucomicrobiota bacterium]|nr:TolC family protein [Verrucomicrobiota bacterium]